MVLSLRARSEPVPERPRSEPVAAQPPPPVRMVPQSMSPRRIELGVSGSSERPDHAIRGVHPRAWEFPLPT